MASKKPKKKAAIAPPERAVPKRKVLTDADLHRIRMQAKRMVAELFASLREDR